MMDKLVWLEEPACQQSILVGSKAANLSRLAAKYPVPSGFCLTTTAFADSANIEQHNNTGAENALPSAIQTLLSDAYQKLAIRNQVESPAVAVRSSAVGEDSEDASFAGQYETYLNIVGETALHNAVARCWAAAQSERVMAYRQQQGQAGEALQIAVLVQQLVSADVALVAFSQHPVTGSSTEIVINATWGLGESLVGGTVTPDSYYVCKADLKPYQQEIATKTAMTILNAQGVQGVHEVRVPRPMQQMPSLLPTQIEEVAAMVRALEIEMGWPVDIECAYLQNQLYLLQCRPITSS